MPSNILGPFEYIRYCYFCIDSSSRLTTIGAYTIIDPGTVLFYFEALLVSRGQVSSMLFYAVLCGPTYIQLDLFVSFFMMMKYGLYIFCFVILSLQWKFAARVARCAKPQRFYSKPLEALIQNLRVSPLASGNDRSTPVPTSQTSVRNITRNPAMSAQPLSEDEVQEKVLRITALLEENEVEIEVTWYLEKNGPLTAITWRGNPKAGNDDDGNPNLIVKYEKGDFPFPKDGVTYTRVHVVNQIPIMPGKIEDASYKYTFRNLG